MLGWYFIVTACIAKAPHESRFLTRHSPHSFAPESNQIILKRENPELTSFMKRAASLKHFLWMFVKQIWQYKYKKKHTQIHIAGTTYTHISSTFYTLWKISNRIKLHSLDIVETSAANSSLFKRVTCLETNYLTTEKRIRII